MSFRTIEMFDQCFQLKKTSKPGEFAEDLRILMTRDGLDILTAAREIQQKIIFFVHERLQEFIDSLKKAGVIGKMEQINYVDANYIIKFFDTIEIAFIECELDTKITELLEQNKEISMADIAECIEIFRQFPKKGYHPSNETKKTVDDFVNDIKKQLTNMSVRDFLKQPSLIRGETECEWGTDLLIPKTTAWKEIRDKAIGAGEEPNFDKLDFDISEMSKEEKEFIRTFAKENKERLMKKGYKEYAFNRYTAREVNRKFRGGLEIRSAQDIAKVLNEKMLPAQKSPVEKMLEWVASIDTCSHKPWIEALAGVLKDPSAKELDIKSALSALGYLRSIYTKTKGDIQKHRFNIDQDKEGMIKALMPSTYMENQPFMPTAVSEGEETDIASITLDKLREKVNNLTKVIGDRKIALENELKELPKIPRSKTKRDKQILDMQKKIGNLRGKMMVLEANANLLMLQAKQGQDPDNNRKLSDQLADNNAQFKSLNSEILELETQSQKFMQSLLNRGELEKKIDKTKADEEDLKKINEQISNVRENIAKRILGLAEIYLN